MRDLRENASAVQSGLDKAQAEKNKTEAERVTTQTQLDSLRQQLDESQKKLTNLKEDLKRSETALLSLRDEQGKLQASVQQSTTDQSRLQGDSKQLDATVKSMSQRRDALATEADGGQPNFDNSRRKSLAGRPRSIVSSGRQRIYRKEADELFKQRTALTTQIQDLQGKANNLKPLADQAGQLERTIADLRSKINELDALRQAIEQSVKGLQQQKDDAAKNSKNYKR